jgi:glycosyltransferase involved in cell wall biosynthesis
MSTGEQVRVALDASAIPANPQGAGYYVVELARALDQRDDLALTVISRRRDGARWRAFAPHSEVAPITPDGRGSRLLYGRLALGRAAGRLTPRPAVFHGPHYTLPRYLRLPAVVTVHDLTFVTHPEWHDRTKVRFFTQALHEVARRATVIICVSERTRADLLEHLRPTGAVVVAPHGIDHERFSPVEPAPGADAAVLARHGIDGPYVLHLGTIEPRKDVPNLVAAFDAVAERHAGLRLVLVGRRGWGTETLDAALDAAKHREAISELGYVLADEVPALLRQASVVAYPSRAEGFGLPALEALACGAPLVTTSDTPMAEVAGGAALLVPAGDVDALAEAIAQILDDPVGVTTRRLAGLDRAAQATWAASAAQHAVAYRLAATQ